MAVLQGRQGTEAAAAAVAVVAADVACAELQWRRFDLLSGHAGDGERRTLRSLLFNLGTQRQLLRQVEAQEALRLQRAQQQQQQQQAAPQPPAAKATTTTAAAAATAGPQLRLVAAGVSLPHPAKVASGGEDAFFVFASSSTAATDGATSEAGRCCGAMGCPEQATSHVPSCPRSVVTARCQRTSVL